MLQYLRLDDMYGPLREGHHWSQEVQLTFPSIICMWQDQRLGLWQMVWHMLPTYPWM